MKANDRRIRHAGAALEAFARMRGEDPDNALRDLLADLMHYADRHEIDFDDELRVARDNYEAER